MARTIVRVIVSGLALAGAVAPSWCAAAELVPHAKVRADEKPVVQQTAYLTIVCDPKARISIDNKDTGLYTPLNDYELPVGRHVVTLIAEGGKSQMLAITLDKAGEHKKLKVKL